MTPEMEQLLELFAQGKKIKKEVVDEWGIYCAMAISFEGLKLQRDNKELLTKIEGHLSKLASTTSTVELGREKVTRLRMTHA